MDEKDKAMFGLIISLYYMMGLVEASGCNANYDFVLESIEDAEKLLFVKEI